MIAFSNSDEARRFARTVFGQIPFLEKVVCGCHTPGDVCRRQQSPILRMPGQGQRFLAELLRAVCVHGSVHLFSELLFDLRIFRRCLQNPRPSHKDLVVLFMANTICIEGLTGSAVDVPSIEMEIARVDCYRSKPSGMAMQGVDLSRLL